MFQNVKEVHGSLFVSITENRCKMTHSLPVGLYTAKPRYMKSRLVLTQNATIPHEDELPDDLKGLPLR